MKQKSITETSRAHLTGIVRRHRWSQVALIGDVPLHHADELAALV